MTGTAAFAALILWDWRTRGTIKQLHSTIAHDVAGYRVSQKENTRPKKGLARADRQRSGKLAPVQTRTLIGVETGIKAFAAVHGHVARHVSKVSYPDSRHSKEDTVIFGVCSLVEKRSGTLA